MPYINLKTNRPVTKEAADQFKADMGQAITSFPGKTEAWLMVGAEECHLYFKGSDEPAAMVEVYVLGSVNSSASEDMTSVVCDSVSRIFDISPSRIYVRYQGIENWGWNGSNF